MLTSTSSVSAPPDACHVCAQSACDAVTLPDAPLDDANESGAAFSSIRSHLGAATHTSSTLQPPPTPQSASFVQCVPGAGAGVPASHTLFLHKNTTAFFVAQS